jgi:hypothetical protein
LQCKAVIEAMSELKASNRSGGELGCSASMGGFWEALLAFHPGDPVACLFPMGVAAAPFLGMDHPLLLSSPNPSQARWVLGLLSLYPLEVKPKSIADQAQWPAAIVAPPWGERTRELLIDDPWLPPFPLDCPSAIKDSEARRVFAAHQRCSGTTYALMSPGIAARTSKDLEYFREELVQKNWLDAVIALPSGGNSATNLEGLLLVLKKDRAVGDPIQMVAAQELLIQRKGKSSKQLWDTNGVKELTQLLNHRRDSSYVRLIPAQELEANGFSFQVSRYLHSEDDLVLQRYLDSRATVQLGDLAPSRLPWPPRGRRHRGAGGYPGRHRRLRPAPSRHQVDPVAGSRLGQGPPAFAGAGRCAVVDQGWSRQGVGGSGPCATHGAWPGVLRGPTQAERPSHTSCSGAVSPQCRRADPVEQGRSGSGSVLRANGRSEGLTRRDSKL